MRKMNVTPPVEYIWPEIGGHFDTFTQILSEFIDNSISNYRAFNPENRSIVITIDEVNKEEVEARIEDAGTGIQDLESALTFGDKTEAQTPLNEHGFGFKHALAAANPENDDWRLFTRREEDLENGQYRLVSAPYRYDIESEAKNLDNDPWPGMFNDTGTIIEFPCDKDLFNTVQKGVRGRAGFEKCLDYLKEDLGYIYAGVIEGGEVTITLKSDSDYHTRVDPTQPDWIDYYEPGDDSTSKDLGGGRVEINYEFGEMRESDYEKYYQRNTSTNGLELRINGRIVHSNLFETVWGKQNHHEYRHFLARVDIRSDDKNALPETKTAKTGIRSGDEILENLFEWVRNTHPNPPRQLSRTVREDTLVGELKEHKETHIRDSSKHIEKNFEVFTNLDPDYPVKVDLYVFDGSDTVLYEAKKDVASVQDIYQLLLYWDGAVEDGLNPNEGILIASDFSPGVEPILNSLNQAEDQNGNNYHLTTKTWQDEGVNYPRP